MTTQMLVRNFHGATIRQRPDGYLSATDMWEGCIKVKTFIIKQ